MNQLSIKKNIKSYLFKLGVGEQLRFIMHLLEDYFFKDLLLNNKSLKKIHDGERCFIFGNGLSVNDIEMSLLKEEFTFGSNFLNYHKDFHKLNVNCFSSVSSPRYLKAIDSRITYTDSKINSEEDIQIWLNEDYVAKYSSNPKIYFNKIDENLNDDVLIFLGSPCYRYIRDNELFINKQVFYLRPSKSVLDVNHQKIDITKRITFYENVVLFNIAIALYMGFKEIYLIGMDYSFEPGREFHFYDELLVSKTIEKEVALQWINKIAKARNIVVHKIMENEEYYKPIFVRYNKNRDKDTIVNDFTKSMGVKLNIIIPNGFSSPVFHGVSWKHVINKVLKV